MRPTSSKGGWGKIALSLCATYVNARTFRCVNGAFEKLEIFLIFMQTGPLRMQIRSESMYVALGL